MNERDETRLRTELHNLLETYSLDPLSIPVKDINNVMEELFVYDNLSLVHLTEIIYNIIVREVNANRGKN